VAMLYEQGKVKHAQGLTLLEDELCNWTPGDKSPDRMDALVHGVTFLNESSGAVVAPVVLEGLGRF